MKNPIELIETAVVILNWNGRKMLEQFLPSVVKYSQRAKIFVADNASTDDSIDFLRKNYPGIELIINKENHGYADGYNRALKKIEARYYVLLNSDVEVTPGWIEPIISMMNARPEIAASQPKILSYYNRRQFEYAGAAGGFIDKDGFMFCRGRMFDSFEEDWGQYDGKTEIFWATGACLFVRADLFRQIGGLDEDFFAHMEEIDVCWRLKNMGYKVFFDSGSVVYHVGGGTLQKINPKKTYLNFRNNLYLLTKNYNQGNFFLKLLYRLFLDGAAAVKFLFDGNPRHSYAVFHAHMSFYKRFRLFYRKRQAMRRSVKKTTISGMYKKSVVFQYFIFRKKKFSELNPDDFTR